MIHHLPGSTPASATATSVESPESVRLFDRSWSSPKAHRGTTHRSASPEETWETIAPHLRDFGITRVADITGIDRIGIPVVTAIRPAGRSLSSAAGKGFTLAAASVSAAMEGIEMHRWEEERSVGFDGSLGDLRADGRLVPDLSAHLTADSLFHDDLAQHWSPIRSLGDDQEWWVPSATIDHPDRHPLEAWSCFTRGTNGLASGNTLLEAITSGILEVIERDAFACAMARSGSLHRLPRVDLDTIDDAVIGELVATLQAADVVPILYDCTSDVDLPVYAAVIADQAAPQLGLFRGYGCHLDPMVAMVRALTEAAQARVLILAGARDDIFRASRSLATRPDAADGTQPFLDAEAIPAVRRTDQSTDSFHGDLAVITSCLAAVGLDLQLVHRYTRPDDVVESVRVVVPGAEGYRFSYYRPGPRARAAMPDLEVVA